MPLVTGLPLDAGRRRRADHDAHFGRGIGTSIAVVTIIAFFPILVNLTRGIEATDPKRRRTAACLWRNALQQMRLVRLRFALPYLFTGLRIAGSSAMLGAMLSEWITGSEGLGNMILDASEMRETELLVGNSVDFCCLGLSSSGRLRPASKRSAALDQSMTSSPIDGAIQPLCSLRDMRTLRNRRRTADRSRVAIAAMADGYRRHASGTHAGAGPARSGATRANGNVLVLAGHSVPDVVRSRTNMHVYPEAGSTSAKPRACCCYGTRSGASRSAPRHDRFNNHRTAAGLAAAAGKLAAAKGQRR